MSIPSQVSHYQVLQQIGKGGMGEVYLARDLNLHRNVALKVLPESFAANEDRLHRFEREARAASALNHPNVAQIYEVSEFNGLHFIVMEYVEGSSLQSLLEERNIEISNIVELAIQLADAIEEAHRKGIVHRDLKPSNVMVNQRGQIKVLDFGLAKMIQPETGSSTFETQITTQEGLVLGTVPFMSPEQALGRPLDHRTDIFSFGSLLYTMITKKNPFQGKTQTESLDKVLHVDPEPISAVIQNVDPEIDRILRKCLQKDLQSRYQSFQDVLVDLRNLKRGITATALTPVKPQKKYRNVLWVASVLALILVGLFFVYRNRRTVPAERITLAVLPFQITTPEEKISYLSIGIPDAIITRLSNLQQMQLRPTSAILAFEKKAFNLEEVREVLQVENVLTGTIQKLEQHFRIRVQLIRAKDGVALWGATYDLTPVDLLSLEDSVSRQVSAALQIQMSPEQSAKLQQRSTNNAEAYEYYLRGRDQLLRYTTEAELNAISFFEKALELDPDFAKARAGIAQAASDMHIRFASDDQVKYWGDRAVEEAQATLKMDPNLGEAHEAMAAVYRKTDFQWDLTIQESDQALRLNSSLYLPHYFKAAAFYHIGLFDRADEEVQLAIRANSADRVEALRTLGVIAFFRGQFSVTIHNLLEVQKLTGKALADWYLAQAYYYDGQPDQAEKILRELMKTSYSGNSARARTSLATILAHQGKKAEAMKLLGEAISSPLLDHHATYSVGVGYAQLGDTGKAVDWLRKSTENGFPCYPWFEMDPLLDPIRNAPAFKELMGQLRQKFQRWENLYT